MQDSLVLNWPSILSFANLIITSAIVIIAFSLFAYILSHNLNSNVARSFSAVVACVMVVYAGDVIVALVDGLPSAVPWLRLEWAGIAFLPAAYLHFSYAVLRTTSAPTPYRRQVVLSAYAVSLVFLGIAVASDLLVRDGIATEHITRLAAGPLFPVFTAYFALATLAGGLNVSRARRRCLTPTSIRRMNYLRYTFVAPALGVFPYLVVTSVSRQLFSTLVLGLATFGNLAVALMLIVMGYSVAYYGILSPDRVVKRSLIQFLLRGPFVGICVIVAMLTIPRVELILGLPRDTVLIFAVMGLIVLLELAMQLASPFIDRLVYRQDEAEMAWFQELNRRLLTTTDLKQFLENLLTAFCELLRVRTGFIATLSGPGRRWQLEAATGDAQASSACLTECEMGTVLFGDHPERTQSLGASELQISRSDGFWLLPLRNNNGEALLGVLGLHADTPDFDLSGVATEAVEALIRQAETALEDRHLQQGVFSTLRKIIPEIDRIQRWRGTVRYSAGESLEMIEDSPVYAPEYQRWVKDALTHYWGGPKLSDSPLLRLRVVARKLQDHQGNPVNALRSTLADAIEALRPAGQRHMTASEWLLYNILEMRYIQGRRVRDIADALAMSESDLYRKQRVALEEVAKALAAMEQQRKP